MCRYHWWYYWCCEPSIVYGSFFYCLHPWCLWFVLVILLQRLEYNWYLVYINIYFYWKLKKYKARFWSRRAPPNDSTMDGSVSFRVQPCVSASDMHVYGWDSSQPFRRHGWMSWRISTSLPIGSQNVTGDITRRSFAFWRRWRWHGSANWWVSFFLPLVSVSPG
jgi:hypothetical protein